MLNHLIEPKAESCIGTPKGGRWFPRELEQPKYAEDDTNPRQGPGDKLIHPIVCVHALIVYPLQNPMLALARQASSIELGELRAVNLHIV